MSLAEAVKAYAEANDDTIQRLIKIMMEAMRAMAELEARVESLEGAKQHEYSEVGDP